MLKNIQKLDKVTLGFLIDNLDSVIANADENEILNIGNELWNSTPQLLAHLYEDGNSEKRDMIERIIHHLSLEGINERIAEVPNLVGLIMHARPEIVREKDFWTKIGDAAYHALSSVRTDPSNVMAAINGLILSGREDLILPVFRMLSTKQIGNVIMSMSRERVGFAWFAELAKHPGIVRELICENSSFQRYSVVVLAGYMRPEEINASNERDPWFSTWLNAEGEIYRDEQAYFFAFLMCRALSNDLDVSTEVVIHTFQALHFALDQNYMPGQAWELLNWRLPYVAFDSDRSAKLRAGVVSKFVHHSLSPYAFLALTADDSIFAKIAKLATNSSRGRRYLRNVLQLVKESLHPGNAGRYQILKDLL
ncbi:hypothetical protein NC77_20350 [Janthinobacterium lividum]|nr:hypothetical protein NC77_20350 [Janthinobacterium lividum]